MHNAAPIANPDTHRERQRRTLLSALVARLRGGFPLRDFNQATPIPFGFVPKLSLDLCPGHIGYRLGKAMVAKHPLDAERLDADRIVATNEIGGQLVTPIPAQVRDTSMEPSNLPLLFSSVARSLLLSGKAALLMPETIQVATVVPGVVYLLAIAGNDRMRQPHVKPYHFGSRREFLGAQTHAETDGSTSMPCPS